MVDLNSPLFKIHPYLKSRGYQILYVYKNNTQLYSVCKKPNL